MEVKTCGFEVGEAEIMGFKVFMFYEHPEWNQCLVRGKGKEYRLSWNGYRFARCYFFVKLQREFPEALEKICQALYVGLL